MAMDDAAQMARRPVPARDTGWAHRTAPKLQRLGLTPNQVSIASVVFAAVAAACFVASARVADGPRILLLLIAAAMMPLRLLCNLFDGMLAVEGGLKSPVGGIYNELPDRFADTLFLAGAGYAVADLAWGAQLGWAAATFSIIVAYVRALGVTLGTAVLRRPHGQAASHAHPDCRLRPFRRGGLRRVAAWQHVGCGAGGDPHWRSPDDR